MSFERVPQPVKSEILSLCGDYHQFLRLVCREWNTLQKANTSRRAQAPNAPQNAPIAHPYVMDAHLALMVWARGEIDAQKGPGRPRANAIAEKWLQAAARRDQPAAMLLCKSWGATDFYSAMGQASKAGSARAVELLYAWTEDAPDLGWVGKADRNRIRIQDVSLLAAAEHGHIALVRRTFGWGAAQLGEAMRRAAANGHTRVVADCFVQLILVARRDATKPTTTYRVNSYEDCLENLGYAMCAAAEKGHASVVDQCARLGAQLFDLNSAMFEAAAGDHVHVVELCEFYGARSYEETLWMAVRSRAIAVFEYCKPHVAAIVIRLACSCAIVYARSESVAEQPTNEKTTATAHASYLEIAASCVDKVVDASVVREVIALAASAGDIKALSISTGHGARHRELYDEMMPLAAKNGQLEVLRALVKWGGTAFTAALKAAALAGHLLVAQQCCEWGADNFSEAIITAAVHNHIAIASHCIAVRDTRDARDAGDAEKLKSSTRRAPRTN
jgi:hypothetical protein